MLVQLDVVAIEILEQIIRSQNFGDFDQLIGVAVAVEERFLSEDHGRKHGAQGPHVERVVVLLEIHQEFWSLEVTRCHSHVVFGVLMIKLSQTPIDKPELKWLGLAT